MRNDSVIKTGAIFLPSLYYSKSNNCIHNKMPHLEKRMLVICSGQEIICNVEENIELQRQRFKI